MNVTLLKTDAQEKTLGRLARFTHSPYGSTLYTIDSVQAERIAVNCLKLGHMSVFEFAHLTFCISCPIFVARQLMRHRNGTFLEKSLRHIKFNPGAVYLGENDDVTDAAYTASFLAYNTLIEKGARKEKARAVLPLGTPTEFIWKLSLRSLLNVFDQRLSPEAQEETREVVEEMFNQTHAYFPHILDAWEEMQTRRS